MADKKNPGRSSNDRIDFGKRVATARAFLRQAEALNRHEARIAAHTAIQTWTNIIAVVMSVIMTAVLGWIAWGQWQASEREVALEYARAENRYAIGLQYADETGYRWSGPAHASKPVDVVLRVLGGDTSIISSRVWQEFLIDYKGDAFDSLVSPPNDWEGCRVLVTNWFRPRTDNPLAIDQTYGSDRVIKTPSVLKRFDRRIPFEPGRTIFEVTYYDAFNEISTDVVSVFGSTVEISRRQKFKPDGFLVEFIPHEDGFFGGMSRGDEAQSPGACATFFSA